MSTCLRLALAAVAAALFAGGVAWAAPQRQPQAGAPAVVFDTPDGWTADRSSEASLNLFNAGRSGVISVTIEATPPGVSLTSFRDNMFRTANCAPLERTESVRLGGRAGVAYYCKPPSDRLAVARAVLVRLDDTHILAVTHSYRLDATGADVQAIEAVIGTARYEGAAP